MESSLTNVHENFIDLNYINDNSVVIDAGACVGDFMRSIQRHERAKRCRIIAIECNYENADELRTRNFPNATVCERALTGQNYGDEVEFYHHEGLAQCGNIMKLIHSKKKRQGRLRRLMIYKVKTLKINDIFSELGIDKIDFLKMDIEGAEKDVLRTMTRKTASRITQLSVEVHRPPLNKSRPVFKRMLERLGYEAQIVGVDAVYGIQKRGGADE